MLLLLCVITGLVWAIGSMVGSVYQGSHYFARGCAGGRGGGGLEVKEEDGITCPRGGFPYPFIIPLILLSFY